MLSTSRTIFIRDYIIADYKHKKAPHDYRTGLYIY